MREAKSLEYIEIARTVKINYGINVTGVEKVKNVFKITSGNENYCLKIIKYEEGHFLYILGAMEHLKEAGFKGILDIIRTKSGAKYIKMNTCFAYLNKWIDARQCNYDNPVDLIEAAKTLANLHILSKGFKPREFMKPRIYYGKWNENFSTRIKEIYDFKRKIEDKDIKSEFDNTYYNAIESEINAANMSIQRINESKYMELSKTSEEIGEFCHHDYAHHNLLIDKDGIKVIDFDYCILDTHLHDLASLIIRKMKNSGFNENDCNLILNTYGSINEVTSEDVKVIASLLTFPQEFWQIGIQYYWENQPWKEDYFNKKLKKTLDDFEIRMEFLNLLYSLKV